MLDAMRDVVVKHFLFHAAQRGAYGCNLRHDIDAIAVFSNHASKTADLSLNPTETFKGGGFGVLLHA